MLLPALLVVLGQASQPNEWDNFPPAGTAAPAQAAPAARPTQAAGASEIPEEAKARYRDAREKLQRNDFGGATAVLNQLAQQYPKWAAVFTARCVAQAGLKYPQYAVEDCTYALSLEPESASAIWWLAESEAALGRKQAAARHYQQYADLRSAEVQPTYRELALKRARELSGGDGQVLQPAPTAQAAAPQPAPRTTPPAGVDPAPYPGTKSSGQIPAVAKDEPPPAQPIPPPPSSPTPAAPSAAPSPALSPPRGPSAAGGCASSGQCQGGQQCKDRGDGVKACMGNGRNGAFCANSKDCVFPGTCKHRNDVVNVCMGGGGAGAFCDEGADCSGGTWCRDRGDGIKVCVAR